MRRTVSTFVVALVTWALMPAVSRAASPELILQTGHVGEVDHLAYSPDGKLVASGSTDGTVKIWSSANGELRSTLPIHHGAIAAVGFVHNGGEVVVVAADGWASRWDAVNATMLASAQCPVDKPEASAVTERAGKILVASSNANQSISLWNFPDSPGADIKALATLDRHKAVVTCMAFSPDGATLASGSANGEVNLWDVDDESLIRTVRGHAMTIRSVAFTTDGKRCIDASDDGIADVWNVQAGGEPKELQMNAPGDGVGAAVLSADGTLAVTGGHPNNDGHEYADLWDTHASAVKLRLVGHTGYVTAAAISPDGKSVATGGLDQSVCLWQTTSGNPKKVASPADRTESSASGACGPANCCARFQARPARHALSERRPMIGTSSAAAAITR